MSQRKKTIMMAVSDDLLTDQRVGRSCDALTEAGYVVELVGRRFSLSDARRLPARPYRTTRMWLLFRKKAVFYAELNIRLFLKMFFSDAALFYANDTDTLLAAYLAARLRHRPLVFDAHELFPEVPELVGRPGVKNFWQHIESRILPRIGNAVQGGAMTVCQSIADYYHDRYGLTMRVVRNVPKPYNVLRIPHKPPFTILYQGAVNEGRGILQVVDAMEYLPDCRFVVAGTGDLFDTLCRYAASRPWHDRIIFLGRQSPEDLRLLASYADLGIVLMENKGLNYYYSLPNRIGDFAMAGVPVLASNYPEIRRVVATYKIGTLLDFDIAADVPPSHLAAVIKNTLAEWHTMPHDEAERRFSLARRNLNWDNEKNVFLSVVGQYL